MNKKLISCICVMALTVSAVAIYHYSKPKISVVMSTYNRANLLPAAIDSILGQTFKDFEFIIINDGSSDDTADVLKKYADQDSRIRILTNPQNKGLVYSLNRGLDAAHGEFIARMDDDDVSLSTRFEKQYDFMKVNPNITATSSFVGQPQSGKVWPFQKKTDSDEMKTDLFLGTVPISHPSLFVRRDFLNTNHIRYNDKYESAEDNKFYLDLYDAGAIIGKVPEVLVLYRVHQTNPPEWNMARYNNTNLFLQDEILPRFDIHTQVTTRPPCEQFHQMVEANKIKKQLPQDLLEYSVEQKCPHNPVVHPFWRDAFIFKDNRVCRLNFRSECGTIQSQSTDTFSLKWDRWGLETFVRINGTWELKKTESANPVKNKAKQIQKSTHQNASKKIKKGKKES